MNPATARRLTRILAEAAVVAASRRGGAAPGELAGRVIAAGLRLGGAAWWVIEQGIFCAELTTAAAAECLSDVSFDPSDLQPSAGRGELRDLRPATATESCIAVYQGTYALGSPVRVVVARPNAGRLMALDKAAAVALSDLVSPAATGIRREHAARLALDLLKVASAEADLTSEVHGLMAATTLNRLAAPRVLWHDSDVLVETDLPGRTIAEIPDAERPAVYHDAVTAWGRTLLDDGFLQVGLRRDRIVVAEGVLGVTRWAGSTATAPAAAALLSALLRGGYGQSPADRKSGRAEVTATLSCGMGLAGDVAEAAQQVLALVTASRRIDATAWRTARPGLRERPGYAPALRRELLLLLRQLIWLRDLGFACGATDLSEPWRQLA